MKRTIEEANYYNKGLTAGYFKIFIDDLKEVPANLQEEYEEGKKAGIIKIEKLLNNDDFDIEKYQKNRQEYIEAFGYLIVLKDYPVSLDKLEEEDKESFYSGYEKASRLNSIVISLEDYLEMTQDKDLNKEPVRRK